jgi:hypothetical protein
MEGGGGLARTRWRQWWEAVFACTSGGSGYSAESLKPSYWGSVAGVPTEMVLGLMVGYSGEVCMR